MKKPERRWFPKKKREDVEIYLERWRTALEERGMRINRFKIEYICACIDGGSIRMNGEMLKREQKFKYLGSVVDARSEASCTGWVEKLEGRRKRRPRKRWRDCIRDDLQLKGIIEEEAQDGN
ncbi:uncharacterized protein [Penaeus vannamei]|uniref:uncharacterized protein n=1 Tax=Penaeus vannamei TaxID=6689 RepID=UPI00387F845D